MRCEPTELEGLQETILSGLQSIGSAIPILGGASGLVQSAIGAGQELQSAITTGIPETIAKAQQVFRDVTDTVARVKGIVERVERADIEGILANAKSTAANAKNVSDRVRALEIEEIVLNAKNVVDRVRRGDLDNILVNTEQVTSKAAGMAEKFVKVAKPIAGGLAVSWLLRKLL